MNRRDLSHYAGCLLGGAIGDALGAPVEFLSLAEIRQRYGKAGICDYVERNEQGLAEFTDDTQMTLFTAEGLLLARERGAWTPNEAIYRAYVRWLRTQRGHSSGPTGELTREGWLLGKPEMWKIRAPGGTCLSALESGRRGSPEMPLNNSKGCGGVMRVAPVGLVFSGEAAFEQGVGAAALTHGHPSGYLAAGVFAQVIAEIITGRNLPDAIQASLCSLGHWPNNSETQHAVERALEAAEAEAAKAESATAAAEDETALSETVEKLGGGWVAEEALAIALFCALRYAQSGDFPAALRLAINHSGDSDSTGAMTGNLLGALLGVECLPPRWLEGIELRGEIERIADMLL